MIKVENTTQPPPTQFAAIERNFHETQAGQGLRKSHTPKKVGVRFGVRAISLNCVDLRGPNTQKHMYCVEFLRVASRFDSNPKSLPLRVRKPLSAYLGCQNVPKCSKPTFWAFFLPKRVYQNAPKCTPYPILYITDSPKPLRPLSLRHWHKQLSTYHWVDP